LLVADMARSNPPITSAFVAELARRLQGQSPALTLALTWITHRLAESGQTIEQQIQAEIQQQAAEQVSIANSIGSLRFLGTMDWQEFVETMSVVEQTLRQDPADIYGKMEFAARPIPPRDRKDRQAQRYTKWKWRSKPAAGAAMAVANAPATSALPDRRGRGALERQCRMRRPWLEALQQTARSAPLTSYLGAIAALALVATAWLVRQAARMACTAVAAADRRAGAAGQQPAGAGLVNWLATLVTQPHPLPRMDYRRACRPTRTLVVVPTLVYSGRISQPVRADGSALPRQPRSQLQFCLLTDFADADAKTCRAMTP
jgi:hypothetical protein